MNKPLPAPRPADPDLHIAIAPGVLDGTHTLVREPGESDERYEARRTLLTALLDFAANQT